MRIRDLLITLGLLAAATGVCVLLRGLSDGDSYVPLVFVLCVLLISRLTEGYTWGIIGSVAAVLGVNFIFTYPYMAFNFSISGYPVTFVTMLAVSLSTSALTTHIKSQERLKLVTEREQMRANLLRAVSHDLRTPLTSISGSVGTVLADPDMPAGRREELLTNVRDDADWLIRMVENLLSVTRMEGQDARLDKTPELVEEVIAEAAGKFKKRFPGVALSVDVPDEALFIAMDPVLIEQVLTNLMENAAIHGATTSLIEIRVSAGTDSAIFSVADNGRGVSRDRLPRLLRSPPELNQGEADKGGRHCMGIGLQVCMAIIKAHGGSLWVRNRSQGGAEFSFSLPVGGDVQHGGKG